MALSAESPNIFHLMTQRNQPYGSVRRCCERCGKMVIPPANLAYVDEEDAYNNPEKYVELIGMIPCNKISEENK